MSRQLSASVPAGDTRNLDYRKHPEIVESLLREFARNRKNKKLLEALVYAHRGLVEYLARKFADRGEPLEDLIQVGYVGLLKALKRFNPDKGVKFTTYATPTITGEIKRHFRDVTWKVKVGRNAKDLSLKRLKTREKMTQRLGRDPSAEELAEELGVSLKQIREAQEVERQRQPASLDALAAGENEDASLYDLLGTTDERLEELAERIAVAQAVERLLDERDKNILYWRLFHGLSQSQVAEKIGISQMHVSRLERRAFSRLRQALA